MYANIDVSLTRSPAHFGNKAGVGGGGGGACREDREQLWKKRTAQQMVAALLQLRRGASAAELCERPEPIHLTLNGRARPDLMRANETAQTGPKNSAGAPSAVEPRAWREWAKSRETQLQASRIRSQPVTERHESDDKAHSLHCHVV